MENMLSESDFQTTVVELKGVRIPLLSHGGLTLINATGGDRIVVDAARTTSDLQSKSDSEDRNLIRYLMRHQHSTPREFADITWLIECPMDLWRQWIRHRTASVNEFSSRYSEVPDVNDETPAESWRRQATTNRQGSSGEFVDEFPDNWEFPKYLHPDYRVSKTPGEYLSLREQSLHEIQRETYQERLRLGIAKEQARKDLCLSTYTRAYWKANLHNTLHFLGLRMDAHAQLEIRIYANAMAKIMEQLFPVTMQAFYDYELNSMRLTSLDQFVIAKMIENGGTMPPPWPIGQFLACQHPDWISLKSCRERDECLVKLQRLDIVQIDLNHPPILKH